MSDTGTACPRIAEDYVPCGLLWCHDGPCVPFVPGGYLPPPILHPLDEWLARRLWRCPLCWRSINAVNAEYLTVFRQGQGDQLSEETEITCWPCECVVRDVG